jgi:hypothetical protein
MWGQLGNQLFLVSSALGLAWDNNATPVFPDLEKEQNWNVPLNKEHLFFRLSTALPENAILEDVALGFYKKIEYKKNIRLMPFDIRLDYFGHYEKRLQEIFAPSEEMECLIHNKYGDLLQLTNTVGMQIRVCSNQRLPFVGWDYYISAMKLFPEDSVFIVSSDRISWVKQHFPKHEKNVVFLDDNYLVEFFLLTKCNHVIAGASTFGYWAAFLNKNPNKKVIVPNRIFSHKDRRTLEGYPCKWNVYPQDWTVLEVPLIRTIPEDILEHTTSSIDW